LLGFNCQQKLCLLLLKIADRQYFSCDVVASVSDIVSRWMGTIESRSIIPHSPTDRGPQTTPHHVARATGIDMITKGFLA
jgi:hypothetical protein